MTIAVYLRYHKPLRITMAMNASPSFQSRASEAFYCCRRQSTAMLQLRPLKKPFEWLIDHEKPTVSKNCLTQLVLVSLLNTAENRVLMR